MNDWIDELPQAANDKSGMTETQRRHAQSLEERKRHNRVTKGIVLFAMMANSMFVAGYTFLDLILSSRAVQNHFMLLALRAENGFRPDVRGTITNLQPFLDSTQIVFIGGLAWCAITVAFGVLFLKWALDPGSRRVRVLMNLLAYPILVCSIAVAGLAHYNSRHVGTYVDKLNSHSPVNEHKAVE